MSRESWVKRRYSPGDVMPAVGTRVRVTADDFEAAPRDDLGTVRSHGAGYVEVEWDRHQDRGHGYTTYSYFANKHEYETFFEEDGRAAA